MPALATTRRRIGRTPAICSAWDALMRPLVLLARRSPTAERSPILSTPPRQAPCGARARDQGIRPGRGCGDPLGPVKPAWQSHRISGERRVVSRMRGLAGVVCSLVAGAVLAGAQPARA